MPKISVYVPDALYAEVRERDIPISTVAQRALQDAVVRERNSEWVARARSRPSRDAPLIDAAALLDEVREEFGA